ncbi:MAG: hypothetical protein AB2777_02835 [Candidatus Thiodiazotropha endolucinida]
MIPIISHGSAGEHGYNYGDFEQYFLDICGSHRDEKRALAFALILYDLRDPQISKALHDPDYWNALDAISSKYLSVFSFHTTTSIPEVRTRERTFYQMSRVIADQHESGKTLIEKYFNLDRQLKLPAILFFQVSNAEIIGSRLVQLQKKTTEESFLEIKEILTGSAEAVSEVTEENYRNDHVIFQLIENNLNDRGIIMFASAIINKAKSVKELLSLFGA